MKIGVNTFGLNQLLSKDFEGTVKSLKEMGFTAIEPCIVFDECYGMPAEQLKAGLKKAGWDGGMWMASEAAARIAYLKEMGIEVPGAHVALTQMIPGGITVLLPGMKKFAVENGLKYYVHSPQKKTIEDAKKVVEDFKLAVKELNEAGVEVLFHNHGDEMVDNDGDTVFAYVMREVPELKVELDVGWVKFAGADVIQTMRDYADRIAIVHYKDVIEGANEENKSTCFTAIGEGSIPLAEILEESKKLNLMDVGHIIDQDDSTGDMMADMRTGIKNLNL